MKKIFTVLCCLLLFYFISHAQTNKYTSLKQMKWLAGSWKGMYKGAQRFGAGIYEMTTFRKDQPANYQPLVYPEVVLEDGYDWGAEEYYSQQRQSNLY